MEGLLGSPSGKFAVKIPLVRDGTHLGILGQEACDAPANDERLLMHSRLLSQEKASTRRDPNGAGHNRS